MQRECRIPTQPAPSALVLTSYISKMVPLLESMSQYGYTSLLTKVYSLFGFPWFSSKFICIIFLDSVYKRGVCVSLSGVSDSLQPHGRYSSWDSPGQNTGVGNLSLLQGIFPTQEVNLGLPHRRQMLYQLSHEGSPLESVYTLKLGKQSAIVACNP